LAHIDVVDDSGTPVPDGQPGRLTYTHLDRTGTVLLRFLVGDRAVLDRSPCPNCGWAGGRVVEHLGRDGNLRKIRGALVNIDAVHRAIEASGGVASHRLEVDVVDGVDSLKAYVATSAPVDEPAVVASVVEAVRRATGVRPLVILSTLDEIWSPDERMKPSRFIDHRQSERWE
jgi:phenylacetate-coenzyme A ligase PaaK-like adenylate-forming protein